MSLRKDVLCVLAALVLSLVLAALALAPGFTTGSAAAAPNDNAYKGELRLGEPGLKEMRTTRQVAPGVTFTRVVRGRESKKDFYTVDVAFEADLRAAKGVARDLRSDGYEPRIERVRERAPDDLRRGPLGYLVRVGEFDGEAGATALRDRLVADGYAEAQVVYSGEDGGETTGPWVVHALEIDPDRYGGTLAPELATEVVPGRELLTSISERTDSLAAVNGGYFVIEDADGTPGDLAGVSMLEGDLVSEAVDGRTGLILPSGSGEDSRVARLSDAISATSSDGARREVDGLNREPGRIRNCGGTDGDEPTERPLHDFTCTDGSELIHFTPDFGSSTEPGAGAEAVLDARGRVTALREGRGGPIPPNGSVLSGTGEAARWLRSHATPGSKVGVEARVTASGKPLNGKTGVVNGGPRLLRGGEARITARAEGFVYPDDPEFYYRFGARRNPRTLAGVTPDGSLLFVTVDGRQPGYSVGASFEESADIMRALGAEDALNLDGGGSTTMTIRERLVNRPSDTTGERPVGDAVVILP